MKLTDTDKQLIRLLQEDLPPGLTPYQTLADQLGLSESELLEKIQAYKASGILRRLGGVVRHHRMGYTHNVMVVWQVAEERLKETGRHMAAQPEISHCYARPVYPDWPYNLYTMVHGTSEEACQQLILRMAKETGVSIYQKLTSLKELKKTSMKYFSE